MLTPHAREKMKRFKRHAENAQDRLNELVVWLSKGSHLSGLLDTVIKELFDDDDFSYSVCTLRESTLDSAYVLLVKSSTFHGCLDLPTMLPLSLVETFSAKGKIVAGFVYGIYAGLHESSLVAYVKDFSGISDECFVREVQIELNEKILSISAKSRLLGCTGEIASKQVDFPNSLPIANLDESPIAILWKESLQWIDQYCSFLDRTNFDSFLLDSTLGKYEVLKRGFVLGKPIVISGAKGSGKSFALNYLAHTFNRPSSSVVRISAGDQLDAKTLLGSYICTEKPGEFKWVPGIVYNCLSNGSWLVIDDFNLISVEVAALLNSIAQSRTLFLPNRNEVLHAKSGFFMFALTTSPQAFGTLSVVNEDYWSVVRFDEMGKEDLFTLVSTKYPSLIRSISSILDVYQLLKESKEYRKWSKRTISAKDLMKWCQLIITLTRNISCDDSLIPLAYFEGIFKAAVVCFISCIPAFDARLEIAHRICTHFYISIEKAEYFLNAYKPDFAVHDSGCSFGAVVIPPFSQLQSTEALEPFAHTGLTCRMFESLAASVSNNWACLLVGETGTGKTTIVQSFARYCKIPKFSVINLNQQSEREDLIGGFKPSSLENMLFALNDEFESLFSQSFNTTNNLSYLESVAAAISHRNISRLVALFCNAAEMYRKKATTNRALEQQWDSFVDRVNQISFRHSQSKNSLIFSFVEGILADAIRHGHWILLDEINLATPEVLNLLNGLVESDCGSVWISERGDLQSIPRHKNFRLFACMNPSTDVNKRDLPETLRGNFMEFFVDELDQNLQDFRAVIHSYISGIITHGFVDKFVTEISDAYYALKQAALDHKLVDGDRKRPHYSLRTLTRALKFATKIFSHFGSIKKCLLEGFLMSFSSILSTESQGIAFSILQTMLLSDVSAENLKALLNSQPTKYSADFIPVEGFLIHRGDCTPCQDSTFVLTPHVHKTLTQVARALMAKNHPILLQGPTSAGKTSLVEYLAKMTGHRFVRINNHEQTDLQEYIGRYHSSPEGKLVFKEGLLIEALKNGYWIVLDELNLASSDILEALNRLLDDNRELFVAETGEVVRPHRNFHLFATQNPSGSIYGGRKMLSRAFRNRFIEIHVEEIPHNELEIILERRCQLPPSYCKKLVSVYCSLISSRESTANLFSGKNGFVTLRDLFKWGKRNADNAEQLAENGFILLAEKMRNEHDREIIKRIIEGVFRVTIDASSIYERIPACLLQDSSVVWTSSMKRLAYLVHQCMLNEEPVLIVGETGCGKTTIVQTLSHLMGRPLSIVNCHQNTETSDLLGSLRPSRKSTQLFEWVDGPLVQSMKEGTHFLLDEISLAEDSVLERLNSLLEPSRSLTLAEKPSDSGSAEPIVASADFRFFATMNPGGDFGKKELSPALRNRFTEIWVPSVENLIDIRQIIKSKIVHETFVERMIAFLDSFARMERKFSYSLRDVIAWIQFFNLNCNQLGSEAALIWGCYLVFANKHAELSKRKHILAMVTDNQTILQSILFAESSEPEYLENGTFRLHDFTFPLGKNQVTSNGYVLQAQTTFRNALKVIAAMSIPKSILLEGSPGVGKTSLVQNLSAAMGYNLFRINLSEQTDLCDLFGSDLPVDGELGSFAWKDGPFLGALKRGDWILLDELNLASQSVLEGLNACLDHRGTIFIPELGVSFQVSPETRIFASQNPLAQGGGRKGLPKSFLNRFTCIYLDSLNMHDYEVVCSQSFPGEPKALIRCMVNFVVSLNDHSQLNAFGTSGAPWELNLRDIFRWFSMKNSGLTLTQSASVLFFGRFRTAADVDFVKKLYFSIFPEEIDVQLDYELSASLFSIGNLRFDLAAIPSLDRKLLNFPVHNLEQLFSLANCIKNNWLSILVGGKSTGKSWTLSSIAQLLGQKTVEIGMSPSVDIQELLGGYEQHDPLIGLNPVLDLALQNALIRLDFEFIKSFKSGKLSNKELLLLAKQKELIEDFDFDAPAGSFVWVDGPIVKAMLEGYWIVLDHANLCSPAVLDRLNSLFESDGSLLLVEQGSTHNQPIRNIIPHPNFRLFMTVNPTFGEISRAMRNRGIEIYFPKSQLPSNSSSSFARFPKTEIDAMILDFSPILDSFSYNFMLDKHLLDIVESNYSTALFLSTFHNEFDKLLRTKITGVECNPSFLISLFNVVKQKCHLENASSEVAAFLELLDAYFLKSVSVEALALRICFCNAIIAGCNQEFVATMMDCIIKSYSFPDVKQIFSDCPKSFASYWNHTLMHSCFTAEEEIECHKKLVEFKGANRKRHHRFFVEFLNRQSDTIQLPCLHDEQSVLKSGKFFGHNYDEPFACFGGQSVWSKFLLMENPFISADASLSLWIDNALNRSNLPVHYIAHVENDNWRLLGCMFNLQERIANPTAYTGSLFLKDILDFCSSFKASKMYQLSGYMENTTAIIDCLCHEWNFISRSSILNDFPFENEVYMLTNLSKSNVCQNPTLLLEFIRQVFSSNDLALELICKMQIQNERFECVKQINAILSQYSILKYGKVRHDLLLDELDFEQRLGRLHLNRRDNFIHRTYRFARLADDILRLLDRITRSNYDFSNLHEFLANIGNRYPDYLDYIVVFGFLVCLFVYLVQVKEEFRNCRGLSTLEHSHLYYLISGDSSGFIEKLLDFQPDTSDSSTDTEADEVEEIVKEIFSAQTKTTDNLLQLGNDDRYLYELVSNNSIATACGNYVSKSISSDIGNRPDLIFYLKTVTLQEKPDFFSPSLEMMLQGSEILEKVFQKSVHLMSTNEELSENPILLQIINQIQPISDLSCSTPLNLLVCNFESFLNSLYTWQQYAHKGISLQPEIDLLSDFILKCRKMEVDSYKNIIQNELNRISKQRVVKLVRHLISLGLSCVDKDSVAEYLKSLDQFLLSGTLGDFECRLCLLEKLSAINCCNVYLSSFIRYYRLIKPYIASKFQAVLAEVNKEYEEFLKVVEWKNVNVLYLRQSTEKSHKSIAKFVRKLRAEMNQPVITIMKDIPFEFVNSAEFPAVEMRFEVSPNITLFGDAFKMNKCIEITRNVLEKISLSSPIGDVVDSIKERVKTLSALTDALMLKTKALDDLLKFLKLKGLVSKRAVIDEFELASYLPLEYSSDDSLHYFRTLYLVNKMVQSYHNHSPFIDHDKATKLIGYVLDLFSTAKAHLLQSRIYLSGQPPFQDDDKLFIVGNVAKIQDFAVNYQIQLLKIELIGKTLDKFSIDSINEFKERAASLQTISKYLSKTQLKKSTDSLIFLLSASLNARPNWITWELEAFLAANQSLHIDSEHFVPKIDVEKSLLFYQNLDTHSIQTLIDVENEDLIDGCFVKLKQNDTIVQNLWNYFSPSSDCQPTGISMFGEQFSAVAVENSISIFKLTGLLCSIGTNLFCNGFCNEHMLPATDENENKDDLQLQDGTGVGEGDTTESKNVSDRIEDESQVEGLKDDPRNDENGKPNPEDEKDFEMDMDFDGEFTDKPDKEEDNEEKSEEESEANADLDDIIGENQDSDEIIEQLNEEFWDEHENELKTEKTGELDNFQQGEENVGRDEELISGNEQNTKSEHDSSDEMEIDDEMNVDQTIEKEENANEPDQEKGDETMVEEHEDKAASDNENQNDVDDRHVSKEEPKEQINPQDQLNEQNDIKQQMPNEMQVENQQEKNNHGAIQNNLQATKNELNASAGSGADQLNQSRNPNEDTESSLTGTHDSTNDKLISGVGSSEQAQNNSLQESSIELQESLGYSSNILPKQELGSSGVESVDKVPHNQLFQHDESNDSMLVQSLSTAPNELTEIYNNYESSEPSSLNQSDLQREEKSFDLFGQADSSKLDEAAKTLDDKISYASNSESSADKEAPSDSWINVPNVKNIDSAETFDMEQDSSLQVANLITPHRESILQWELIEGKISHLSCELCEQLRLILEPTLASRLKGSYRSGKRLDMKKIIPFIASDYKKDKIWLRRTKPATRKYQILISIDDSKSMQLENAALMAFESLAMISKALSTLESGQIGVLAFGDSCKLVHALNEPLVSSEFGPKIIENLKFSQSKTNMLNLLQESFRLLTTSRQSSDWQLHVILSDGIIHENIQQIQQLVRKCFEHKILIVFIIVDCKKNSKDSITKMNNVSYLSDPSTGKLTLKMQRYLDTFPFEHYLVLSTVAHLPGVLADALRQWFDLIKLDN